MSLNFLNVSLRNNIQNEDEISHLKKCLDISKEEINFLSTYVEELEKKLEIAKKQRNKFIDKFFACDPDPGFKLTGNQAIYDKYDLELEITKKPDSSKKKP